MNRTRAQFIIGLASLLLGPSAQAQFDLSEGRQFSCSAYKETRRVVAMPAVSNEMLAEACKAIDISSKALRVRYKSRAVDSVWVMRHDFPNLETGAVTSVYQVGAWLKGERTYAEVVVDRKTWNAQVQHQDPPKR